MAAPSDLAPPPQAPAPVVTAPQRQLPSTDGWRFSLPDNALAIEPVRPMPLAPRSEAQRQHSVALLRQKAYDHHRDSLLEQLRVSKQETCDARAALEQLRIELGGERDAALVPRMRPPLTSPTAPTPRRPPHSTHPTSAQIVLLICIASHGAKSSKFTYQPARMQLLRLERARLTKRLPRPRSSRSRSAPPRRRHCCRRSKRRRTRCEPRRCEVMG